MITQFQVHVDARGDFQVADGTLIDRGTGAIWDVGDGDPAGSSLVGEEATNLSETVEVPAVTDIVLVGGSGSNVIVSGLGAPLDGIYRPGRPGFWSKGVFVIEVTDVSAATLKDEEGEVVAELTTGGTAPLGSYVATTYGEETYNGSAGFTLTGTGETGWPGGFVDMAIEILSGTAMGGEFTAVDRASWVSAADADWTLVLADNGMAELIYQGEVMARRDGGPPDDPCGDYVSTEAGRFMNPVFPDRDEAEFFETNPFGLLELEFNWSGEPDLDIGVGFLGQMVGYAHGLAEWMTWGGDNTTDGGPENVTVDLAQAWEDGAISTFADVVACADWFPSGGGSGPASLTVTYDGVTTTHVLHAPGQETPSTTAALAMRITDAGLEIVGEEWTARVRAVRRPPVAGVVYIEVTETAGVVTAVDGPFFAAAMSSPVGGMVPFPLASSDGAGGLKQHHQGPLVWV